MRSLSGERWWGGHSFRVPASGVVTRNDDSHDAGEVTGLLRPDDGALRRSGERPWSRTRTQPPRREVVRAHEVARECLPQRGRQLLHALGHGTLVGRDDLVAAGGLAAVELLHLRRRVAGLHHHIALGTAQLDEQLVALALLPAQG